MWRWTNKENIKAVILDIESLDDEYINYPFESDVPNIKIFDVAILDEPKVNNHIYIEYYDVTKLLYEIMETYNLNSCDIVAISKDHLFLKEMMQNHIGTVFVGELNKEYLKDTPDYTYKSLNSIFSKRGMGYGAEVMASMPDSEMKKYLLKSESKIELENGENKIIHLYFGGRYYSKKRNYILDDPLTKTILNFKEEYNDIVNDFYDRALTSLSKKYPIDILTYVPLKPRDIVENRFDRFSSLKLKSMRIKGISLQSIVQCNRNFTQKGNDATQRAENVKGAYSINGDVKGKTVVVLDDIYATGATINEIARVLYKKGAENVIAVFLAVNQLTESLSQKYKHICCSECGTKMRLVVRKDSKLFFGCGEYPKCRYTMKLDEGLKQLKRINRIAINDVDDLDDSY